MKEAILAYPVPLAPDFVAEAALKRYLGITDQLARMKHGDLNTENATPIALQLATCEWIRLSAGLSQPGINTVEVVQRTLLAEQEAAEAAIVGAADGDFTDLRAYLHGKRQYHANALLGISKGRMAVSADKFNSHQTLVDRYTQCRSLIPDIGQPARVKVEFSNS